MSFVIRALGFLDCCTAVVMIIFQIATVSKYPWQPLERVVVGIWAGISFMITGVIYWRAGGREKRSGVYNHWEVASALISFLCSIVLIGIMAANIQTINEDWYCVYQFIRKDHCTVEKALDGVMLFGGCFALVINAVLTIVSCYCYD